MEVRMWVPTTDICYCLRDVTYVYVESIFIHHICYLKVVFNIFTIIFMVFIWNDRSSTVDSNINAWWFPGFGFWHQKPVFDMTLWKTWFELTKTIFDIKKHQTLSKTLVVLNVMFIGQMPMFLIWMHLFILLRVWFLILSLELKQNNSLQYSLCDSSSLFHVYIGLLLAILLKFNCVNNHHFDLFACT